MNDRAAPADPGQSEPRLWHAIPLAELLHALQVDPSRGISEEQARQRRLIAGRNVLQGAAPRSALRRFFSQFHNVLIYLLLVAAAVTFLLGERIDALVIMMSVVVNALIGFFQEGNAERALKAIASLLPFNCMVLRSGERCCVPSEDLVPGDIVFLASGDRVPADLRMVAAKSLQIDESILTGESAPADKRVGHASADAALAERSGMAHSGTLVRHGTGVGLVVGTGANTEMGRISAILQAIEPLGTPLLRKIAVFGHWVTAAVLVLACAMFVFGIIWRNYSAFDMFTATVGLAVAAVPEGLPAAITITLAIGVRRMARRQAIIRRLPAVEALGAATVICTDKTGTLTRNEMAVIRILAADGIVDVGAAGYAPEGRFSSGGKQLDSLAAVQLRPLALVGLLCNDAKLHCLDGQWEVSGDPTEGAMLSLALKAGLDPAHEHACLPRVDTIAFESEHGFMATLHAGPDGRQSILLKGAPERIVPLCTTQRRDGLDEQVAHAKWEHMMAAAAQDGLRLIAVAMRTPAQVLAELDFATVYAGGFTLLGILALADPPRAEAVAAVRTCLAAGIRIKMITGDHPATAKAIGEALGFPKPVQTLTGTQLDHLDEAGLDAALDVTDVFARASPEHKLRLVRNLQRRGEVVVMTGDGVNDAPALKRADVGVAMGRKGTEAAKEAAEVVLADDNFATLAAAVEEGRLVYDNIRKTIVFTLPTNGGEAGMLIVAVLFGLTLPITPVQILWVNMVTEVTLSLALAFEKPESDLMARPPRAPSEPLVTGLLLWRMLLVSTLMVGGCMALFAWQLCENASLAQARTVVVNALVVAHIAYLLNTRRLSGSALSWEGLTGNRVALAGMAGTLLLQVVLTYWPPVQIAFGTTGIGVQAWFAIVAFGMALMLAVEMEKGVRRWYGRRTVPFAGKWG